MRCCGTRAKVSWCNERTHLRMKQSMTEDADAEGEINQIVVAELVTNVVEAQR